MLVFFFLFRHPESLTLCYRLNALDHNYFLIPLSRKVFEFVLYHFIELINFWQDVDFSPSVDRSIGRSIIGHKWVELCTPGCNKLAWFNP